MNKKVCTNTALEPTPKLEEDAYDWWQRHRDVLDVKAQFAPEVVLIGDSITHFWGGPPASDLVNGARAWEETFRQCPVLNLGFGWDRTQNVLWRLDHGEFDGLQPRTVVLNIGTNNFTATANARANSPEEVVEAIIAICTRVRCRSAQSRIIVMGVFPRWQHPNDPGRRPIEQLNALLEKELAQSDVTFLDIGAQLLEPDGTISPETMSDFCHPTEKGYSIWGSALRKLDMMDV
jgi:lysophospholipase L1-like esterase